MKHFDLMLCGGGVVGLSIAYECARHGWKVILVEADTIGRGASWAGAGILPAGSTLPTLDPVEQLRSMSHRLHGLWAECLREFTGIDNEYRRCGGLYLARTLAERATLAAHLAWWQEHGIHYESWTAERLSSAVPLLAHDTGLHHSTTSWFVPGDARLRNPRHIRALRQACVTLGVTICENQPIDDIRTKHDRIVEACSGVNRYRADRYCITSGAWASQLLMPLGIQTGILPVRGQMVLFKLDAPPFPMVINDGHRYLVPRDDGHVLAGSCEEEVGFNTQTTESMILELQAWAKSLYPELTSSKVVRVWAGLRPGSFDSYPYLGTLHPYGNGYIAAGHFRHGLHWSTATAVLMRQWMSDEPTEIDLGPFCVVRGKTLGSQLHQEPGTGMAGNGK